MQVMSKENLDRMLGEIELLSATLRFIDQNRAMLGMEHGIQALQQTATDLKFQRLELTLKTEALHKFLTE